ncbi:HNH/endonuclease VII fold putative polymorphic toxin [Streptomyces sp. wa1002]|uniref:HNH/endonuclease VII fold putative polymorphic toxin n=1 Tax=Streptomyces sp. wa1002 TaxID=1828186 RepID=UPI000D1CF25E|nr:HNH/endonuclease VII fold putative polymorphic toxin [Streptomyces sp. wa1002]
MSQQNPASGDAPPTGPVSPSGPVHGWWQRLSSWQRVVLPAGILTLVIAVIAAAVLNSGSSSDGSPTAARDLRPFREAVDDLAKAPGLQYKDSSAFGITENTLTVTAAGSTYGTTNSGPSDHARDVLRIGGKKFTRWQVDPAPRNRPAAGEKAPPSEWSVGLDDGSMLTDEALARTLPPPKLAAVLDKALADLEKSPPPAASSSKGSDTSGQHKLNVNGTPALGIDTSAGRLLVTKQKPHRALRLEPYDLREDIADMRDQLENGETPTAPRKVTIGPLAAGGAEGMDLAPVLADAADKMFDTLVEYADQLENATDQGISFTLDNAGEMDCSPKGCTATQSFTGNVSSIARKERVTKGEVSAVMSATFSIDGKPAGECTSPQRTFPVRGNNVSGTLKCSNPGAGPLYASVAARVQAQAQADADRCGCKVRLTYPVRANTLIDARALAKVEAKKLADQAKAERTAADCAKPHSFPTGTHVLLANGTTRPIEDIRIGDFVTAGDPQTGRTAARPVTNTFTTEGDKNFTRITVTTGQRPAATITATDNHPFWLPQDQQWKDAGALRTGDELRTPNGSGATVTEVRDQQGRQRTHDLTVDDLHTYYVLAGATPILVHNSDCVPSTRTLPSRNSAFRAAKRDLRIPNNQQPDKLNMVPMTDRSGNNILNPDGTRVMTREYVFTRRGGDRVIIQDHSYGHYYGEGGVGDQRSHFNVRPFENPRTGKVPGTAQHYEY